MTDNISEAEKAVREQLGVAEDSPMAEYRRQREEQNRKRGQPHGLSAAQVEAADRFGMELARYAAYLDVASVDGFRSAEELLARRADAKKQAEHEAFVAEERREL